MKFTIQGLFLSHPDPMWVYDLLTLRFVAVNLAAIKTYGYSEAEFLAMTIADIHPRDDCAALNDSVAAVEAGRETGGIWRHYRRSGEMIYADVSGQRVDHEGRSAELIVARDVSRFVRTEQSPSMLPENDAHALLETGTWDYSVSADCLSLSTHVYQIYGIAADRFGHRMTDYIGLVHPNDRARTKEAFDDLVMSGEGRHAFTHRVLHPDGRSINIHGVAEWVNTTEGPVLRGVVQDASQLVAMRQRAEESEKLLEIAGRAVKLGGWRVSLVDRTVFWTDGVAAMHELPPGTQPTYEAGIDHFAPEEREAARRVFEACALDGIPFNDVRALITAKGNRIRVRSMGEPVRDELGRIIAVQGAIQDISELTNAQRQAEEIGARLTEVMENIGEAFFTLDREWRFSYLNNRAEVFLGRCRHALIGRKVFDEFPEAKGTATEVECRRAFDTGKTVRFDQNYAPLSAIFRVTAHPTPNGLAVYFSDITKEQQREEQLRLLDVAIAQINDLVIITEAGNPAADDQPKIVYVNDAFVNRTGHRREEVLGQTPRILQGPKTQRLELDRIRAALTACKPVRAELINYTKSGEEYWLELDIVPIADDAGVPTHFVSVQRDITHRRITEAALQVSETRFRLIAQATGNAIWELDIARELLWWSDGFTALFGHETDPRGMLASVWHANVHPDDKVRVDKTESHLLSGEAEQSLQRYRFRRGDGSWAEVEDHVFLLRDVEGRPQRLLGSMTDISERLNLEARLQQSHKLEAVGQLTGGIAHDFNNLLMIVMGNVELIQDGLDLEHPLRPCADMIAIASDRAAELTNRLLAFSRKQTLQPRVLDVNAVVTEMEEMLRRTLSQDIDIELGTADGLWRTEVDPGQIESALLNLAINGRDAMAGGGVLTIKTANVVLDDDDVAAEPRLTPGEFVMIAVCDTGHGIPQDQIERVFEPFFTTKPVGKGTGLGLSMVYGFVKQTGGHICIFSELGKGVTVEMYFPRYRGGEPAAAAAVVVEERPLPRGQETILIVEDDGMILQQLAAQLASLDYHVVAASTGAAALAILRDRSDFDLLLTDVVLPGGMNGRDVAEAARIIHSGLKILYTSGYPQNAISHSGRLDDGMELLRKPYRRADLAAKVRKVLDG